MVFFGSPSVALWSSAYTTRPAIAWRQVAPRGPAASHCSGAPLVTEISPSLLPHLVELPLPHVWLSVFSLERLFVSLQTNAATVFNSFIKKKKKYIRNAILISWSVPVVSWEAFPVNGAIQQPSLCRSSSAGSASGGQMGSGHSHLMFLQCFLRSEWWRLQPSASPAVCGGQVRTLPS